MDFLQYGQNLRVYGIISARVIVFSFVDVSTFLEFLIQQNRLDKFFQLVFRQQNTQAQRTFIQRHTMIVLSVQFTFARRTFHTNPSSRQVSIYQ